MWRLKGTAKHSGAAVGASIVEEMGSRRRTWAM
jgi:hypothetical protein